MTDAADIEKSLEEKSTTELQIAIRNSHLTEHASAIARAILEQRGVPIPGPIPEEVLEERHRTTLRNSNRSFVLTIIVLCLWIGYGLATELFEPGEQKRLNQSMLIAFVSIASIWGVPAQSCEK
jgi:hypothetical protein